MRPAITIFALMLGLHSGPALAQGKSHMSKYAGQEKRAIKGLSADDIAELKRGGGWGLAKVAELNGVPGPAHLLELKDKIPLSSDQVSKITAIYRDMKSKAISLGLQLIDRERKLEILFRDRTITDTTLKSSLEAIASVRRELRYAHLSAHLTTPSILSNVQMKRYNALRGYGSANPCNNVPAGHNASMWRRHNGCK